MSAGRPARLAVGVVSAGRVGAVMEYGMPPTGGIGLGIDRLLMTLTGLGIRETILYPLVRNE